jgi:hypothetical protein
MVGTVVVEAVELENQMGNVWTSLLAMPVAGVTVTIGWHLELVGVDLSMPGMIALAASMDSHHFPRPIHL